MIEYKLYYFDMIDDYIKRMIYDHYLSLSFKDRKYRFYTKTSDEQILKHILFDKYKFIYCAIDETTNNIVGLCTLHSNNELTVSILSNFRGQGISKQLISLSKEVNKFHLNVSINNPIMHKLCKSLKFKIKRKTKNFVKYEV